MKNRFLNKLHLSDKRIADIIESLHTLYVILYGLSIVSSLVGIYLMINTQDKGYSFLTRIPLFFLITISVSQFIWGGCPLTYLENYYRTRIDNKFRLTHEHTFIVRSVKKYFGVSLSARAVTILIILFGALSIVVFLGAEAIFNFKI